jgi:hypothetical protein
LPADGLRLQEILSQESSKPHEASECCEALALSRDKSVLSSGRRVPLAKVLNLGGFDVLMTPFEPDEVLRIAFAAWSRWECGFVASSAREAETAGCRRMSGFSD